MKTNLYLINGPLGAGKTTVLKRILQDSKFEGARVIENEFANISVDADQLSEHNHNTDIQTISGVCVCCSTGDELIDALDHFTHSGNKAPVIIEATGVANSLQLVEKLVNSNILDEYEIAQAFFVIDVFSINKEMLKEYRDEMLAADFVLATKWDLIDKATQEDKKNLLVDCGLEKRALKSTSGIFDLSKIGDKSGILEYFMNHSGKNSKQDKALNYTVVKTDKLKIDLNVLNKLWKKYIDKYHIERMKGDIIEPDNKGAVHIEATSKHFSHEKKNASLSNLGKMIFIGKLASRITQKSFEDDLRYLSRNVIDTEDTV